MGDNKIIDEIMDKVPKAKEAVEKVEEATGKKIEDIANEVGLSVSAAIERIKKLESSGVIKKYTAIVDNEKIGNELLAIVTVRLDHPKYSDAFIEEALNNPAIIECHYVAGDYDYLLKVNTKNSSSLEKIIQSIKSIYGVARTNTTIVLSSLKNEYTILNEKGE